MRWRRVEVHGVSSGGRGVCVVGVDFTKATRAPDAFSKQLYKHRNPGCFSRAFLIIPKTLRGKKKVDSDGGGYTQLPGTSTCIWHPSQTSLETTSHPQLGHDGSFGEG